jgi:hypothetical protein
MHTDYFFHLIQFARTHITSNQASIGLGWVLLYILTHCRLCKHLVSMLDHHNLCNFRDLSGQSKYSVQPLYCWSCLIWTELDVSCDFVCILTLKNTILYGMLCSGDTCDGEAGIGERRHYSLIKKGEIRWKLVKQNDDQYIYISVATHGHSTSLI